MEKKTDSRLTSGINKEETREAVGKRFMTIKCKFY